MEKMVRGNHSPIIFGRLTQKWEKLQGHFNFRVSRNQAQEVGLPGANVIEGIMNGAAEQWHLPGRVNRVELLLEPLTQVKAVLVGGTKPSEARAGHYKCLKG